MEDLFLLLLGYAIATTLILAAGAGRRSVAAPATVILQSETDDSNAGCLVPLVLLAVAMMIILVWLGG